MPTDELISTATGEFSELLTSFDGLGPRQSYDVSALRADSNWSWASIPGVYLFVRDDEVLYVGRALRTVGARLWSHLQSREDEVWAAVLDDPATRVEVIAVDDRQLFLAAALEVFLIERLKPRFNSRIC